MQKSDYDRLADSVFQEINAVRQDPKSLIPFVRAARTHFRDLEYRNPANEFFVLTKEGVKAIDDALAFLEKAPSRPALARNPQIDRAAGMLADQIGREGLVAHGEGDFELIARIKASVGQVGNLAENLSFGWKDPREVVMQMIVDDGLPTRGHRQSLFSGEFAQVGVASGPHKLYNHVTVVNFYGNPSTDEESFKEFEIDKKYWPENASNVQKHIEVTYKENKRFVRSTYEFEMPDGRKVIKERLFLKPLK